MTVVFNMKPTKTPLPAKKQVILEFLYDSEARRIKTAPEKQGKYLHRISDMLKKREVSVTSSAVQWLPKGRSKNARGNEYLACWELQKYKLRCKISPGWIPGEKNRTADALSRERIPKWLKLRGIQARCDLEKIRYQLAHAELSWRAAL